jgi:hypothetical protein
MNKNRIWAKRVAWLYIIGSCALIVHEIASSENINLFLLALASVNFLIGFYALTQLEYTNQKSLKLANQIRRKGDKLYYRQSLGFTGLRFKEQVIALRRVSKVIIGNAYCVIILDGNGNALTFHTLESEKEIDGALNLLFTQTERGNITIEYSEKMELA